MQELLGLPIQASAHAGEIDQMIVLVHWVMALLFVGWGMFFIYTLIRFRAAANPTADYAGVKSHTSSYLEIAIAVIEAVLLVGFAIPAWANRVNEFPPEEESTVVHMIGKTVRVAHALPGCGWPVRPSRYQPDHRDERHRPRSERSQWGR